MVEHRIIDQQEEHRFTEILGQINLVHPQDVRMPFGNFLRVTEKLDLTTVEIDKDAQMSLDVLFKCGLAAVTVNGGASSTPLEALGDINDLLLFLPSSMSDATGLMTEWINLGTEGATGDLTENGFFSVSAPAAVTTVPLIGKVSGLSSNNQAIGTLADQVCAAAGNSNDDSEMWILMKTTSGGDVYGIICIFDDDGGGTSTSWGYTNAGGGGIFIFTTGNVSRFGSCPAIYNDGEWHVFRTIHNLSSDKITFEVDGYPLGSNDFTGSLSQVGAVGATFVHGPFNTGNSIIGQVALMKMTEGFLSPGRDQEILAYLRDTWGVTSIPADGTAIIAITGSPLGADYSLHSTVFLAGVATAVFGVGTAGQAYGRSIRKDNVNEYIYYGEGGSPGRMSRRDFNGGNFLRVTTTAPAGLKIHGLALNLSSNECYVTHDTDGIQISKHSLDPANAADAWTNLLGSGTYKIWQAIEYHPTDDLIYFIDSLAGTPTLRTITTAGASDTLVKSLTAGKVYGFLVKDPDANVLYFTNETDNTIEKYDIGTGFHTTSWHVPTNKPNGIDVQAGKLWYFEETTDKIYEVILTTPGSKTELGSDTLASDWGGLAVIVFDTTI